MLRVMGGEDGPSSAPAKTNEAKLQGVRQADPVDHARSMEYLLLANILTRAPSAELLSEITNIRGDASPLGMAHLALAGAARATVPADVGAEYLRLFVGVGRGEILPYGSFYLTGFLNERPLARVREDLIRLGIARKDQVFEPEDHIGSLFEVMAGLIGGAFEGHTAAADAFFNRHIAPWAGRLMTDIANAPSAQFYKPVAALGIAWLEIETAAMRIPE